MLFLEILFLVSLAFALAALIKPAVYRSRWMQLLPVFTLLLMLLQLLLRGFLWQLFPVYVASILLLLLRARGIFAATVGEPGRPAVRPNKRWLRLSAAVLGYFSLAFSVAFLLVFPVFHLPEPSGPYAIGTTELYLNDKARSEVFTPNPEDTRKLMVKVWYPAEEIKGNSEQYIEPEIAAAYASQNGFPSFLSSHMPLIRSHRFAGVPLATDKEQYPVLIFSHGLRVPVVFYSAFLEELASQGYVIFAIQHTYETAGVLFPDNRMAVYNANAIPVGDRWDKVWQINQEYLSSKNPVLRKAKVYKMNEVEPMADRVRAWAADIHFVLDELERLNKQEGSFFYHALDMERLGGFGHSLGGAAMGQAMLSESRLKAAANFDGAQWGDLIEGGFEQPFLALDAARDPEVYPFILPNPVIYQEANLPGLAYLQVEGAKHSNFSDLGYLTPLRLISEAGPITHERCIQLINKLTLSFFNAHLKQQGSFPGGLKQSEIIVVMKKKE